MNIKLKKWTQALLAGLCLCFTVPAFAERELIKVSSGFTIEDYTNRERRHFNDLDAACKWALEVYQEDYIATAGITSQIYHSGTFFYLSNGGSPGSPTALLGCNFIWDALDEYMQWHSYPKWGGFADAICESGGGVYEDKLDGCYEWVECDPNYYPEGQLPEVCKQPETDPCDPGKPENLNLNGKLPDFCCDPEQNQSAGTLEQCKKPDPCDPGKPENLNLNGKLPDFCCDPEQNKNAESLGQCKLDLCDPSLFRSGSVPDECKEPEPPEHECVKARKELLENGTLMPEGKGCSEFPPNPSLCDDALELEKESENYDDKKDKNKNRLGFVACKEVPGKLPVYRECFETKRMPKEKDENGKETDKQKYKNPQARQMIYKCAIEHEKEHIFYPIKKGCKEGMLGADKFNGDLQKTEINSYKKSVACLEEEDKKCLDYTCKVDLSMAIAEAKSGVLYFTNWLNNL